MFPEWVTSFLIMGSIALLAPRPAFAKRKDEAFDVILMRGGSFKGLYFRAADLPSDPSVRDRLLLAAMGSPDRRQSDGLGGGDEQGSKVMIVGASSEPGVDVECLYAQPLHEGCYLAALPAGLGIGIVNA